jgi:hypothetical protein
MCLHDSVGMLDCVLRIGKEVLSLRFSFSTHDEDVIYRIWDEESTPYGTNYLENFVYEDGKNPRDIPCAELYDWCDELKLASDDVSGCWLTGLMAIYPDCQNTGVVRRSRWNSEDPRRDCCQVGATSGEPGRYTEVAPFFEGVLSCDCKTA